jgi:hypothetical protein
LRIKRKGDVAWYLRHTDKRPITWSTKAVSDCIAYLRSFCNSYEEMLENCVYAPDEKKIIELYKENNIPYEEFLVR